MLPRLVQQRMVNVFKTVRSYSSTSHTTSKLPAEGFNSAAWKLGVVGVVGLLVWYEWDQRIQQQGQTNPIAKFFADYFPSATLWEDRNAQHYRLVQSAAQDQLLVRTMTRPPIRRLTDTMAFDRGSPFGVPVGSQADLSDLKIRTD